MRRRGVAVFCGGLRNRLAIARFERILVVACSERWPDGSRRPALEDLAGAGGIFAALGRADASAEARAVAAILDEDASDVAARLVEDCFIAA